MILIALGANLPSLYGTPRSTLAQAFYQLSCHVTLIRRSDFYETPPWPPSDQPNYINAVAQIQTELKPHSLMELLHDIEKKFGRVRKEQNEARPLDLDLIAYNNQIIEGQGGLIVPHPRMHQRLFVLDPLCDIDPNWQHPVLRKTARVLRQECQKMEAGL